MSGSSEPPRGRTAEERARAAAERAARRAARKGKRPAALQPSERALDPVDVPPPDAFGLPPTSGLRDSVGGDEPPVEPPPRRRSRPSPETPSTPAVRSPRTGGEDRVARDEVRQPEARSPRPAADEATTRVHRAEPPGPEEQAPAAGRGGPHWSAAFPPGTAPAPPPRGDEAHVLPPTDDEAVARAASGGSLLDDPEVDAPTVGSAPAEPAAPEAEAGDTAEAALPPTGEHPPAPDASGQEAGAAAAHAGDDAPSGRAPDEDTIPPDEGTLDQPTQAWQLPDDVRDDTDSHEAIDARDADAMQGHDLPYDGPDGDTELYDEPVATARPIPLAARSGRSGGSRRGGGGRRGGSGRPSGAVLADPEGRRGPRWGRRMLALLALLAIAAALYLINATFQPFHQSGTGAVRVEIPEGANVAEIGSVLEEEGVVDSGTFFNVNVTLTGRRGRLRPGDYTLRRDMSYGDVSEALMQGPEVRVVETFDLAIPEGLTRRDMAEIVEESPVTGDYLRTTRRASFIRRARDLGLPSGSRSLEGFLFPATYELTGDADARQLVDKQLDAFERNFEDVDMSLARRRNLTRYDVLTIASMVEREAAVAEERPLIAAVIHNRLREGMPLGIDATIRYATDNWSRPIRQSELDEDGPYNTRLRQGLPPTPIGNPGLDSIRAAANPADVDYTYYVVKPGTCGEHAFSSSAEQFERDVQRYQSARAAEGGQSPTNC